MAVYIVSGHPINWSELGLANAEAVRAALQIVGVGGSVTIALSGPDDAKVKGHGCLK